MPPPATSSLPHRNPSTIIGSMNTNHIARFEDVVQRLVEGTFARLFAGRLRPLEVANALAHAMEDRAIPGPGSSLLAPNHYGVALNPADYGAMLAQQPQLADDLARHLFDLAQQAGFVLADLPLVNLNAQPGVPLHQARVTARWLAPESDHTLQMPLPTRTALDDQALPTCPFLILEGQRHLALTHAAVSLGRSLDNEIIVDDARVSRHHAQLRRRYDRYVIYDLGSTGGTTVNGYPVQECVLEAGDVISLAGVEIIYGEDTPTPTAAPRGAGSTPAMRRTPETETHELPALPAEGAES